MNLMTHFTRISSLLALLAACVTPAWADGTLTHLSGPVSVQKSDGSRQTGSVGTKVLTGDTVFTGPAGFARLEMTDGGEMVLRPDSQLRLDAYAFAKDRPEQDNVVFRLLKGGLRTVTGLISKRGNTDAYKFTTSTATIGIRGTQYDVRVCEANCGALGDGTYLAVRYGLVQSSNEFGVLQVAAGQFAHMAQGRAPALLPRDPGIGFTPPASIPKLDEKKKAAATAAAAGSTSSGGSSTAAGGDAASSSSSASTLSGGECAVQ